MNKHPYYDTDRKKSTEEFALKAIAYCLLIVVLTYLITACSTDSPVMGPAHNYEVPDTLEPVDTQSDTI